MNFHHPPVILQCVQPRPRQHVLPGRGVAILRLVHVPEDDEVYSAQSASPGARMCPALLCAFSIDILHAKLCPTASLASLSLLSYSSSRSSCV